MGDFVTWGDDRLPARFWEKAVPEPNSGCWLWLDMDNSADRTASYRFDQRRRSRAARPHRLAFEALIHPLDVGMVALPRCNNSACVNPSHFKISTRSESSTQLLDLAGKRFGRLTVAERALQRWRCVCDCGDERLATSTWLLSGDVTNCGCQKHGKYGTPTYRSWQSMLSRCRNENTPYFKNYGGRGIRVCERWLDFKSFIEDMGERPQGMTIDRIDPNGNYELSNCRWSTWHEQAANKRNSRNRISDAMNTAILAVSSGPEILSKSDVVALLSRLRSAFVGDK
jgi:hypothetical protein